MNPEQAVEAVSQKATVVARTLQGDVYAEGQIIAYSVVPTVLILRPDGSRVSWRHDLTEVKPEEDR